ncbi:MAG: aminoacyl-histidine dipeptidase [Bacteroidetes bacterium]|nr:aminoacyl-histidine dipeptidase [Bacteroidota bacterium]
MSTTVRNLEPRTLWNHFADLNAVPRPSKREGRVIEFIKKFGERLGLPTSVDATGNVLIKKPASGGMEGKPVVMLQGHLDMVHQKNAAINFDFETQGIRMFVEGDWVKAEGTTLGADNGIGVASIMTLLASHDIPHPPIEALFTIDEETGLSGAKGLQGGLLHAKYLLNLDTEDDRELTIGCAGGVDVTGEGSYEQEPVPGDVQAFRIGVKGLTGGHSGMDIHLGRGNANKLMNRLLSGGAAQCGLRISAIEGGSLRNAIPRESFAVVVVPAAQSVAFQAFIKQEAATLQAENRTTDPDLAVVCEATTLPGKVLDKEFQQKLLRVIYACANGIHRMSPDIKDLVQTSNNLSRVLVKDGQYSIQCLTRGSVDSEKMDLANAIKSTLELVGAKVTFGSEYPGWQPMPESRIVKLMSSIYEDLYKEKPHVNACHAGLECGILGTNYPDMEMISFGPNIRGAHSPDEKVQISSVQKYWQFLLRTLQEI